MAGETLLYSAMNIGAPWRGLNVHPSDAAAVLELPAVMFLSGGLSAAAVVTPPPDSLPTRIGPGNHGGQNKKDITVGDRVFVTRKTAPEPAETEQEAPRQIPIEMLSGELLAQLSAVLPASAVGPDLSALRLRRQIQEEDELLILGIL